MPRGFSNGQYRPRETQGETLIQKGLQNSGSYGPTHKDSTV